MYSRIVSSAYFVRGDASADGKLRLFEDCLAHLRYTFVDRDAMLFAVIGDTYTCFDLSRVSRKPEENSNLLEICFIRTGRTHGLVVAPEDFHDSVRHLRVQVKVVGDNDQLWTKSLSDKRRHSRANAIFPGIVGGCGQNTFANLPPIISVNDGACSRRHPRRKPFLSNRDCAATLHSERGLDVS